MPGCTTLSGRLGPGWTGHSVRTAQVTSLQEGPVHRPPPGPAVTTGLLGGRDWLRAEDQVLGAAHPACGSPPSRQAPRALPCKDPLGQMGKTPQPRRVGTGPWVPRRWDHGCGCGPRQPTQTASERCCEGRAAAPMVPANTRGDPGGGARLPRAPGIPTSRTHNVHTCCGHRTDQGPMTVQNQSRAGT